MARNPKSAAARVLRAKTILLIGSPFYGSLICNLDIKEDNEICGTMATDGTSIFWNRDFVDSLTDANIVFVLAHETAHCANLHHVRRAGRDPQEWNIACDYAINIDLVDAKVGVAPDSVLLERAFKKWSAERIYGHRAKQPKQPKQPQPGQGEGKGGCGGVPAPGEGEGETKPGKGAGSGKAGDPGKCGEVLDGGKTPEEQRKQEREWQRNVRQAVNTAMKAGGAGSIPGGMREVMKKLKGGGDDWKHALRNFVDPSSRQDYTFARPDRRFTGMPFILPGTVSDGVNHIVGVRDVSGSVDTEKCSRFTLEMQAMLDQGFMDKLTLIDCDTKVQRVAEFVPGEILPLDVTGRGGTSFKPVWEWVAESGEDISALVYFTDLDSNDGWGDEPRCPVLWACQDEDARRTPPFGDLVTIGS
jgi:predicted metal-dependent peptidase